MSVCFDCCVLSCRGLFNELITDQEESYLLWCVVECDPGTSIMRRSWPTGGEVCFVKIKCTYRPGVHKTHKNLASNSKF